jgi:hypothetical protein
MGLIRLSAGPADMLCFHFLHTRSAPESTRRLNRRYAAWRVLSLSRTLATAAAVHSPLPVGVGTPSAFIAAARAYDRHSAYSLRASSRLTSIQNLVYRATRATQLARNLCCAPACLFQFQNASM